MPRTLVTGAAGFTGRYVVEELAGLGHEVHAIVHRASDGPIDGVREVYEADLTDLDRVSSAVATIRPDHVIHLAAIAFVAHGDIEQMYRTNVVGTRQLLEALAGTETPPASVVVASSANIYGNAREGQLDEDVPAAPANDYGVSKVASEYVASLYASRLPIIVTRPFNYTGRGQSDSFLIPKIVSHVRRNADVIELGNVDVARDFSDVRAVADAYVRLLTASGAIGETFNICSGRPVTLQQVIDLAAQVSGHRMDVQVNPAFVRANEVRTLSGSAAKLERAIGPLKAISLEETLRWMIEG
jgi:nucleoside-diphosphate-sugar epimerase